jgi:hypothetical protein
MELIKYREHPERLECPVCYTTTNNMDAFYDCSHVICDSCHAAWQFKQNNCPLCRAPVDVPPRTNFMIHMWCTTQVLIIVHVLIFNIFDFLVKIIYIDPEYEY